MPTPEDRDQEDTDDIQCKTCFNHILYPDIASSVFNSVWGCTCRKHESKGGGKRCRDHETPMEIAVIAMSGIMMDATAVWISLR
jgi:hypothetical protein